MATFTSSLKPKLIYVFRINDKAHHGSLKVGEATADEMEGYFSPSSKQLNQSAKKRINGYTQTAGIAYDLLYTEGTLFMKNGVMNSFNDKQVHQVLERSGVRKKVFNIEANADEWFITDLGTVKKAIAAVKDGRQSLYAHEVTQNENPIEFRPEQRDAIIKTEKQFKRSNQMLWYAKMRFGKTLSSLQVVKEMEYKRTIILTHRPVVDAGWFEDFGKIFYDRKDYMYGSKNKGCTFKTLKEELSNGKKIVFFVSIQDLGGSEQVGGKFDKNNEIFATPWDLIIVDEAHEGVQTELGKAVLKELIKPTTKVIRLSGTPFNLLNDFKEDEIYNWDYVMEQRAKMEWDKIHLGDPNPYEELPALNIYTYDLGRLMNDYIDDDVAFNFREFFRTKEADGTFVHENDVRAFLDLMTRSDKESLYPFATQEFRDNFRHTLWILPGVKEARALSNMLHQHPVFQHFTIVNVAGDGDEDEENEEALKMVNERITDHPENTYTVTLSCGRLTTGVTVKAWTAVFMLSGAFKTSASSYMQTIFRVQSPAVIAGKMKENCYAFDFAPDRTLRVLAEVAHVSTKAGKTTDSERLKMGEFLNFCPVISVQGSQMKPYDVPQMLEQLKKAYIDHVVSHGFEDSYLYNDKLLKLSTIELNKFENLKRIIGTTKAMSHPDEIDINKQGLINEEYEELNELEKKKRKQKDSLTEEEKQRLEELKEKKKTRNTAISTLRGISIRMPMLIYGAEVKNETELTIDNFTHLVDDLSWTEFMPKGVTKEVFEEFKEYYDPDIFNAAGKQIRQTVRAADKLTVEQRIERIAGLFSTFRNPDKETVLTPWRVVNMHMGDCLGGYNFYDPDYKEMLANPRYIFRGEVTTDVFKADAKILEINSKSGLYPLYMAYGIYKTCLTASIIPVTTVEEQNQVWDTVVAANIFVICKTPMAKSITKRTLIGFRDAKVNTKYFEDLINQIKNKSQQFIDKVTNGKTYWKANNIEKMKFDAIVGNPPYQEMDGGGAGSSAIPVYNKFVDISRILKPNYLSMIMPSKWYSGGKGLDQFRESMLEDTRIRKLVDFDDSRDCFQGVDIAGGICYFLWDKNYNGNCQVVNYKNGGEQATNRFLNEFNTFIRETNAIDIINKVKKRKEKTLLSVVFSRNPFGLASNFKGKDNSFIGAIKLFGSTGISYIEKNEITNNINLIDKWKVIISKTSSEHAGQSDKEGRRRILSRIEVLKPNSVCTESYLLLDVFDNEYQANNMKNYVKTNFFRFLLSTILLTQNISKDKFQFVPIQDFTENSDINWSKSIAEIDQQLYQKYQLTEEEIAFIEKMIKPI